MGKWDNNEQIIKKSWGNNGKLTGPQWETSGLYMFILG